MTTNSNDFVKCGGCGKTLDVTVADDRARRAQEAKNLRARGRKIDFHPNAISTYQNVIKLVCRQPLMCVDCAYKQIQEHHYGGVSIL